GLERLDSQDLRGEIERGAAGPAVAEARARLPHLPPGGGTPIEHAPPALPDVGEGLVVAAGVVERGELVIGEVGGASLDQAAGAVLVGGLVDEVEDLRLLFFGG